MVTEARIGKLTISVWNIIAIVGGLFALIALFLQWLSVSDFGGLETFKITGLDLLSGKLNDTVVTYSFVSKLPLMIAILGVLIIILSLVTIFVKREYGLAIVLVILSVVALILCIVFIAVGLKSSLFSGDWKTMAEASGVTYAIGAGTVLATIGSIVTAVCGALNIKEYR